METEHITREQLEQFEQKQLKGSEYVEVLLHLNTCLYCRQYLRIPSKEELKKKLFEDESEDEPFES